MALIGNCTVTKTVASETETTTITETLPDGTTQEVETPVMVEESTDYTNIYLSIKQIELFQSYFTNASMARDKNTFLFVQIGGYTDKATKYNDPENYLFYESLSLPSFSYDQNLYQQIYDHIKTLDGYTELTND